jgi:hypothetical protein
MRATTITLSREQEVDFTLMTFVTGGSLLSLADSKINAISDTAGKSVAVVTGTTSEAALKKALSSNLIDAKVVSVASREEAMKQLDAGQVAAVASDQIVLIGQIIQSADPKKYSLASDLFSYEPYAFVVRRDDSDFRLVANRALAQLYRTGQIEPLYNQWFGKVRHQALARAERDVRASSIARVNDSPRCLSSRQRGSATASSRRIETRLMQGVASTFHLGVFPSQLEVVQWQTLLKALDSLLMRR